MSKKKIIILIATGILIIGIVLGIIVAIFYKIDMEKKYDEKNNNYQTLSKEFNVVNDKISFNIDCNRVNIVEDDITNIKIDYSVSDYFSNDVEIKDGVIYIDSNESDMWKIIFDTNTTKSERKAALRRLISIGHIDFDIYTVTITIPNAFDKDFEIIMNNGKTVISTLSPKNNISLESYNGELITNTIDSLECTSIKLHNGKVKTDIVQVLGDLTISSENGEIDIDRIDCGGNLTSTLYNGKISIDEIVAKNTSKFTTNNGTVCLGKVESSNIYLSTDNGTLEIKKLSSNNTNLETNNGTIKCLFVGYKKDYKSLVTVSNGTCNIESSLDGEKIIVAKVNNGTIKIDFENK